MTPIDPSKGHECTQLRSSSQTPPARFIKTGRPLAPFLAAIAALAVYLFVPQAWRHAPHAQIPQAREAALHFTKEGQRIRIPPGSPLRGKLTIAEVAEKSIQHTLVLPAVVEANPARSVKVLPPLAGRVVDLKVQLGGRVTEGQILAVLDSADLAQAYADHAKARSTLTFTKQALDRQLALEKARAAAIKDREQAQNDYALAEAEFKRSELRLKAIGVAPDPPDPSRLLYVKAPMSGSIIDLQIGLGAYLNDSTAAIMTIADLNTVWVTANVPEKDTASVRKDQPVDVVFTAYPGKIFKGRVLFVSDLLEPDTRRTKVRIAFDNPDVQLKPNMFASATFLSPTTSLPVIPTTALLLRDEVDQVFVEVAPWEFEARRIETEPLGSDQAAVTQGLQAGERIVTSGGVLIND